MSHKILSSLIPSVGADGGEDNVIVALAPVAVVEVLPGRVEALQSKSVSEEKNGKDKTVNLPETSLFYLFLSPIEWNRNTYLYGQTPIPLQRIVSPVVFDRCNQLLCDVLRIIKMVMI